MSMSPKARAEAWEVMKSRRGTTASPMSTEKSLSAAAPSSTATCLPNQTNTPHSATGGMWAERSTRAL